jgi:D-glycero-beta-D-manno-heptose-7-phosphate kinase
MSNLLKNLVPRLANHTVLVAGDVILDEYVIGTAARISREAPVPVLEFKERRYIPGGAANPASNIVALKSRAVQAGIIGEDSAAQHLRDALKARGIETPALVTCPERPTTLKTRILAQMGLRFPQQVARVDTLSRDPVSPKTEAHILEGIQTQIGQVNAVLVSDYQTGMLTPALVNAIRDMARAAGVLLTADAQGSLEKYTGFDVVKCNADDARDYLRRSLQNDADFAGAALDLCRTLALTGAMVITRGGDGATLAQPDGTTAQCPAPAVSDVFDTVGAGDTWIAVMTLAVLAGAAYVDAVRLSNYASGIVVRHVGNYAPSPEELAAALE